MAPTNDLRVYTAPADPRQKRLNEIRVEIKTLEAERADLKASLLLGGICEECSAPFHRVRVTKRYCSQACNIKHSLRKRIVRWDRDLLAENLPLLEASGQLTPRVLEMVKLVVRDGVAANQIAVDTGLSRERVGQHLGRATAVCKMLVAIRASVEASMAKSEATHV